MLIGYARVSTQDQSPALQLDALRAAGCNRIFEEKASGAQRDRPELKAALDYIRDGDVLAVWKLDRLARSLGQLIDTVDSLKERGIGFRSLTEQIDTTTPAGKLTFHIFGAMAEFERSIIRERTRAGLDAARARGRMGGRPRALTLKDLGGQGTAQRCVDHVRGGIAAAQGGARHALPPSSGRPKRNHLTCSPEIVAKAD
jgi:DNA invertase Pin-like site-specific DNA recombinase